MLEVEEAQTCVPTGGSADTPRRKAFRAKLATVRDVQGQLARLYREARSGTISTQDATRLASILGLLGRMIGDGDLEDRIAALEAKGVR